VASKKKRSSGKRKTQRKGLSGNPQRRAEQLAQLETDAAWTHLDPDYIPRPKINPSPWWPESHARILAAARADSWPSQPVDLETRACQLIGDEFYERIRSSEEGLHMSHWLATLAARAGEELRTAIENDTPDSDRLWAFLCGLALIAPRSSSPLETGNAKVARLMTPLDDDPFEVAQAEAAKAAEARANRGLMDEAATPADPSRLAGEPVLARDAYGSRFLLAAPFGYGQDEPDHWYAWDIDMCALDVVVGAGVFGSATEALEEWRDAVGTAASGSALAACPEQAIPVLLDSCLNTGLRADSVDGLEPRELVREMYRLRQRARALAWHAGFPAGDSYDYSSVRHAFQAWYAGRHDTVPEDLGDIVDAVIYDWGPQEYPDAESFYACSPHRIEDTAIVLRDRYIPEYANAALLMLPEWVEWCMSQISLDEVFGARSRAAARAESMALAGDDSAPTEPDDEELFRRQE
jgi:hypothetical protein